ncbi:unnamed protein product [Caenorhabditis auriculariae]|uniref:Uncharacterized protein n=1 Tax=Caenorhabditis auriculariae TaxID=2777116 RepID=A0A8S1GS16_9PELO|nr:unnamed protein product [Caenorhabditis auriculariae]
MLVAREFDSTFLFEIPIRLLGMKEEMLIRILVRGVSVADLQKHLPLGADEELRSTSLQEVGEVRERIRTISSRHSGDEDGSDEGAEVHAGKREKDSGYKSWRKSKEDISPLNISNMNFYALIGAVLVAAVAVSAEKARAPQFFV